MDTLGFERVPARNTNVVLGDTYIVGPRIGLGAMGEVYLAQHARLPGQFAVKMLLPELTGNQDAFARFCREAEIMSQLRHPNIVQIFDFNVAPDGRPYFVMEHLQGRDLEARLNAGPLPLPAITRIVDAVSSALALAHAHGVVHRDLKPANVFLVSVDGQTDELIKVLDFGISKLRSAVQISHAVDVLGTPSYMAPEQARGQAAAIDGRTDQFAVGALAYRMLTGHEPFQGEDTASVLYQVVHQDPPPISLFLPPDWDAGPLQAVLDRALAKQPEQRFGGMMELARAFDDAAERTIGPSAPSEPSAGPGGGSLRATAAQARHLDDADIDVPPPVRTPTPVLLRPKQSLAAPALPEAAGPALPPVLKPPPQLATTVPRVIDWDGLDTVDEVPKTRGRGVALALLALGIVALLIATGWYRKLPGAAAVRQKIHEWTGPSGAAPQSAAPAPTPEAAAPAAATTAAPTPASRAAQPAAAATPDPAPTASTTPPAAPDKPRAHRRSAPRNHRKQAARPAAPSTAEAPRPAPEGTEAAPGTAEAPGPATQAAPGTAEAPRPAPPAAPGAAEAPAEGKPVANPPLNGGAFEIAPPTPMQARPDSRSAPGRRTDASPLALSPPRPESL